MVIRLPQGRTQMGDCVVLRTLNNFAEIQFVRFYLKHIPIDSLGLGAKENG